MLKTLAIACLGILTAGSALGDDPKANGDKAMSGMSIVGNDDAPKALVIVPWKSSALGDALDVSRVLNDARQPVDRDVFMRELDYYQIRESSGDGHPGAK